MPEPVVPSPLTIIEPTTAPAAEGSPPVPVPVRDAARRVLAADGREFVLQPWQAAWLVATSEGREGVVPPGCGVGAGWLRDRLEEALGEARPR